MIFFKRKYFFYLSIFLLASFLCAWIPLSLENPPKKIVLSFDDIPLSSTHFMSLESRTRSVVEVLQKEGVQAVFFSVGDHLEHNKQQGSECLNQLVIANQVIANHTYSHAHLSSSNVDEFIEDVIKNEKIFSTFPSYQKWFRYPYLDIGLNPKLGGSLEKARQMALALKNLGYRHGYMTIDSYDWYINALLLKAIAEKKTVDWDKLESFYIAHLRKAVKGYTNQKALKYSDVIHVILFHANDLNALFLSKTIEMLRNEGWQLTNPEEAFNSPNNPLNDFETIIVLKDKDKSLENSPLKMYDTEEINREFQKCILLH